MPAHSTGMGVSDPSDSSPFHVIEFFRIGSIQFLLVDPP
jgi:hypothetical protein